MVLTKKKRNLKRKRMSIDGLANFLSETVVEVMRVIPKEAFSHDENDPKEVWIEDFKMEFYLGKQRDGKMLAEIYGTFCEQYRNGEAVGVPSNTLRKEFKKRVIVPASFYNDKYVGALKEKQEEVGFKRSNAALMLYGRN